MRMKHKRVIVTGAGSGIGAACAELLASEGASVVLVGRSEGKLAAVAAQITATGGAASIFTADLQHADTVDGLFDKILQASPRIDGLINCAAVGSSWSQTSPGSMNDIASTPIDRYHEIMRLNLDSTVYMCRLAVAQMQRQGSGSIVNLSSVYGIQAPATHHTYSLTKAAIVQLTRLMAVSYAKDGIRVNCIVPGYIDTPMNDGVGDIFADERLAASLMPMMRPGAPQEVAHACLYLLSDEASYTTGVILPVDGGWCAK